MGGKCMDSVGFLWADDRPMGFPSVGVAVSAIRERGWPGCNHQIPAGASSEEFNFLAGSSKYVIKLIKGDRGWISLGLITYPTR